MTIRDDVNVYKVPFTMTVTGFATVIADSQEAAVRAAKTMDLGDYISQHDSHIEISDEYGFFTDYESVETVGMGAVGDVRVDESYDPSDHPDYDPSEHDEEEETPAEESK